GDCILGLPLGTDEKDRASLRGAVLHELARVFEHLERLLQVDDVNAVALPEDVFLHLGIPALGLVPEVNARFEQLFHGDVSQNTSSLNCILRGTSCPLGIDSLLRSRPCGREDFWSRLIPGSPPSGPQAANQIETQRRDEACLVATIRSLSAC